MKRALAQSICFIFILSLAVSCSKTKEPLSAAQLLDLGEKHMLELNYNEAISDYLELIEIDPKNEQAYVMLAEAYNLSGEPEKKQAALKMGYALVEDDEDTGFVESITEALYGRDEDSLLALCLELWVLSHEQYNSDNDRDDAINKLLLQRENVILRLRSDEEFYFGGYDDEGQKLGFGICFYGDGIDNGITIYIGNWYKGLRDGEGAAYYGVYYYIKGYWTMDAPVGLMISGYTSEPTSEGEYIVADEQFDFLRHYEENRRQFQSIWAGGNRYIN